MLVEKFIIVQYIETALSYGSSFNNHPIQAFVNVSFDYTSEYESKEEAERALSIHASNYMSYSILSIYKFIR